MVGFEKALRAVKVIKDQIQYRSQRLLNLARGYFRARSHEPETVNYPGASVTSRSHDDLLSRGNFIAPGQVHRHLITTNLSEFL